MKYIKYLVIVTLLLIPLNVFAKSVVYSSGFSFGYLDQKLGRIKNATFELQNISGEKIADIKADPSGEYEILYHIYSADYEEVEDSDLFLIFDEEHREIIKELLSNNKYRNIEDFNEYISTIETDEIIQLAITSPPGLDGWGITGSTPVKLVEKSSEYPICLYNNVYFRIIFELNETKLSVSMLGNPYYIDKTDDISQIHKERFKKDPVTGNYYEDEEEPSEFKQKYLKVKTYQSYSNNCIQRPTEAPLQGVEDCDMLTLYKNISEETIMLDDKLNLISYFNNKFNSDSISIMDIEDKSILKIENNVIIPLKIGSTRIKMNVDNDIFYFKVNIKDLKSNSSIPNNPNTGTISTVLSILVIIASVIILTNKNQILRRNYDRD